MNIRKALLLTLIVAIATLGLTLTGCEKKSDQPPAEPTTPQDMVDAAKQVTEETNKATEDAKKAVEDIAEDADKTVDETADSAEKALEETKAAAEKPAADHPGH